MSDQTRTRRLTVGLTAETVEALEAEAERRGVTIVSLAGWLLTEHVRELATGVERGRSTRFCTAVGDETIVAVGLGVQRSVQFMASLLRGVSGEVGALRGSSPPLSLVGLDGRGQSVRLSGA